MNIVLDTNVLVSAVIARSTPYRLVQRAAMCDDIAMFTSPALLAELNRVLRRPKFATRLAASATTVDAEIAKILRVTHIVRPRVVPRIVTRDPDDDQVIACAQAARAEVIVSGDADLLALGALGDVTIMSSAAALDMLTTFDPIFDR